MTEEERTQLNEMAAQVAQLAGKLDVYAHVIGNLVGQLSEGAAIRPQEIRSSLIFRYQDRPASDPAAVTAAALISALPR